MCYLFTSLSCIHTFFIPTDCGEYCIEDTFRGHCGSDEVIMITSAEYGRFEVGKCVKQDMGEIFIIYLSQKHSNTDAIFLLILF